MTPELEKFVSDELLDQRGVDMAEIPGGSTGILCKDYKGKEADRMVTKIDNWLGQPTVSLE